MLKSISILSLAIFLTKIFTFIVETRLARILEPSIFGQIGFSIVSVSYFALILNKGIEIFGTREIARYPNEINLYINNLIALRLPFLVLSYLALYIFVWLIPNSWDYSTKLLIAIYSIQLIPLALSCEWILQGIQRMDIMAYCQIFGQFMYIISVFLFIKNKPHYYLVPIFFVTSSIISFFLMFHYLTKKYKIQKLKISIPFWRSALIHSLPMGASVVMATIYNSLDHLLLSIWKGNETLGYYRSGYRLIAIAYIIPQIISQVFFPAISKLHQSQDQEKIKTLQLYLKLMIASGIFVGVSISILSNQIINFLYGSSYFPAIEPLRILGLNMSIALMSYTFGQPLLALNKHNEHLKIVSLGAGSNLLFNIILIPEHGMIGASLATLFSELIVCVAFYRKFSAIFELSLKSYFGKPVFGIICMIFTFILIEFFTNRLIVISICGMIVYSSILLFTKYFSLTENKPSSG